MARVSVQYHVENALSIDAQKEISEYLHPLSGVKSIQVNLETHILCVDYEDTRTSEETLESTLKNFLYEIELIDKITF